jgi:hypothetical protein
MHITDASINRFLKLAKENKDKEFEFEDERLNAMEVYKQWTKEEQTVRSQYDRFDWRSSYLINSVLSRLDNPNVITGFKVNADSIMFVSLLRSELLNHVLYDWERKTVAINKMFEAQNNLKELNSI